MIGKEFLPVTLEECRERGWDRPDFVYVTGDAYVDHPSFGVAIISRKKQAFGSQYCLSPTINPPQSSKNSESPGSDFW